MITTKRAVGISIAERTIEIAEVESSNKGASILNLGRIRFGAGVITHGRIKNEKRLIGLIDKALKTAKPQPITAKRIIFALPESVVFTFRFALKDVGEKEKYAAILEEVKKNVPLAQENLVFDYCATEEDVLVVATDRLVVEEWKNFFNKIKIQVDYFDVEVLASFRGLVNKPAKEPVCLIDIGSISTNIAIFNEQGLQHSFLIPLAGESFTDDLALQLKIDLTDAEAKKKQVDLKRGDSLANTLVKSLEPLCDEVEKSIIFFQNKLGQEIKKVILIGGSSKIKGLLEYFKSNLNISTILGQPFLRQKNTKIKASSFYLNAIGSALRDLDEQWANDPAIRVKEQKLAISNKPAKMIFILILIIIAGIGLVGLSFWYKNHNKQINNNVEEVVQIPAPALAPTTTQEQMASEKKVKALIKETPTGWLNVRSGPGTQYPSLMKVNTGEEYEFLEQGDKWVKIKTFDKQEGWVFDAYVQLIE
ncbi:MAG: pilus assembly protein PilM [bacterium]